MDGPAGRLRQADDNIADMFVDGANETAIRESLSARPSFAGTADLALGGLGDSAGALPFLEARGVDAGWNRALREDEIQLLGDDPYALFRPRLRFHFVPASSGPDTTAPTVSSVTVPSAGDEITVQMSEDVTTGSGGSGGWTCSLSGVTVTAAIDGVDASIVRLTPSRTIAQGENFTVGYTQPGDGLQDADGNLVQTLSGQVVSNNSLQSGHSEVYMPIQPTTTTPSFIVPPAVRDGVRRSWIEDPDPNWALPAGHFLPSIRPLEVIAPRPASEIGNNPSVYNRYPPGVRYEVPVLALGGSFPYYGRLTSGPPGAVLRMQYSHANRELYGYVEVPGGMTPGSHTFSVTLTDQEFRAASCSWTVDVSSEYMACVDPANTADPARDGSWDHPWASIDELYANSMDTSVIDYATGTAHSGKVAFLRAAGTYGFTNSGATAMQLGMNKPRIWVGNPDLAHGDVRIDCSSGWLSFNRDPVTDAHLSHITLDGGLSSNANPHQLIWNVANQHRCGVFKFGSENYSGGTSNADNPDAISFFHTTTSSFRRHCYAKILKSKNVTGLGNGSCLKVSSTEDCVWENLIAEDCSGNQYAYQQKYYGAGMSLWRLVEIAGTSSGGVTINAAKASNDLEAGQPVVLEYCYGRHFRLAGSFQVDYVHGLLGLRRCTGIDDFILGSSQADLYLNANVIQGLFDSQNAIPGYGTRGTLYDADDHLVASSGLVDSNGQLIEPYRSTWLGKRGWEIA